MASGTSFEVAGICPGYVPHYGTSPIAAHGAGHLSDHFDLVQIYYDPKPGNGRWRLWRKTPLAESIYGTVDRPPMPDQGGVKIGNLWRHKSTIVAAIAKYLSLIHI